MDHDGHRDYTLHIKDLRTGKDPRINSVWWFMRSGADNKTLFYGREDAPNVRSIWRHTLAIRRGRPVVAEEKDELYRLYAGKNAQPGVHHG